MRVDYAEDVLSVFGYFWQRVWKDQEFISGLADAIGTLQQQSDITYNEFKEHMSRLTVPVFHHKRWTRLTFKYSEMKIRTYGIFDGLQVGKSVLIGSSVPPVEYMLPWKATLQTPFITSTASLTPDIIQNENTDYRIEADKNRIVFYSNPFDIFPTIASVDDNGDPMSSIECWGYCSEEDESNVKDFFGTYVGIRARASDLFKRLTNAIWDLYTQGATVTNINKILLVLTDCDSVTADGTVLDIFTEAGREWVSTDTGLYSAPEGTGVIVALNDKIYIGQNLFNTFKIYKGPETIPDSVVPSFRVEAGYLGGGYISGLSFDNKSVDLTFEYKVTPVPGIPPEDQPQILTDDSGLVLVIDKNGTEYILTDNTAYEDSGLISQGVVPVPIFEIGGFEEDIQRFRDIMAFNIWNLKADVFGKLTEAQAPPYTINPFEYIKNEAFRNNIMFIEMNASAILSSDTVKSAMRYLVNTIPAGTSFMISFKKDAPIEEYDFASQVEETLTGYIVSELSDEHLEINTVDTIHANKKVG